MHRWSPPVATRAIGDDSRIGIDALDTVCPSQHPHHSALKQRRSRFRFSIHWRCPATDIQHPGVDIHTHREPVGRSGKGYFIISVILDMDRDGRIADKWSICFASLEVPLPLSDTT